MKKILLFWVIIISLLQANAQQLITIGNGTSFSDGPSPFYTYYNDRRTQMLYLADEIGTAGVITSIGFRIPNSYSGQVMNSFNIKMGTTSLTLFPDLQSVVTSGLTTVYSGLYAVPGSGWQMIVLNNPFEYDGQDNLLIEICFDNSSYSSSTAVYYTNFDNIYRTAYVHSDYGSGCSLTYSTRTNTRADIRLLIEPAGNCPPVEDLMVQRNASGMEAVWSSPDSISSFAIAITDDGVNVNNAAFTDTVSTHSYNIPSHLEAGSIYNVFVRAICDEGEISGWKSFTFTMQAPPDTVPYFCDFENGEENMKWIQRTLPTLDNKWTIGTATAQSGSHSLYVSNDNGNHNFYTDQLGVIWAYRDVFFPENGAGAYELSFDYKYNSQSTFGDNGFFYIGEPSDVVAISNANYFRPENVQSLRDFGFGMDNLQASAQWKHIVITLPMDESYHGNIKRLYFGFGSSTDGKTAQTPPAIDNISIQELDCDIPYQITASSITEDEVSLTWKTVNPQTLFKVTYWNILTFETVSITTSDTAIVISSLEANSAYNVSVQSSCGEDEFGLPSTVFSFNTACEPLFPFPYQENFNRFIYDFANDDYFLSPLQCWTLYPGVGGYIPELIRTSAQNGRLSLPRNSMAVMPLFGEDISNMMLSLELNCNVVCVGYLTDIEDVSSYLPLDTFFYEGLTNYIQKELYFQDYDLPTGVNCLALTTYSQYVDIDNLYVGEIRSCQTPLDITFTEIDEDSLQLSWTPREGITQYEIAWGTWVNQIEYIDTVMVSNPQFYFPNLQESIQYIARVRSVCGGEERSEWSPMQAYWVEGWNCSFLEFELPHQINSTIDRETRTITVLMPANYIDSLLAPTFTLYGGVYTYEYIDGVFTVTYTPSASRAYVNNELQQSGVSAHVFNQPIHYYTESENGSHHLLWTVNVVPLGTIVCDDFCEIQFRLNDSYGDGWNGAALLVPIADGSTIAISNQRSLSTIVTLPICAGNLQLSWQHGNYDAECSFELSDMDNNILLNNNDLTEIPLAALPNENIFYIPQICNYTPGLRYFAPTNIDVNVVDFVWQSVGNSSQYKFRYKIHGASTWTEISEITDTSYHLSGLSSSTIYDFQIKSVNEMQEESEWTKMITIQTLKAGNDAGCPIYSHFSAKKDVDLGKYDYEIFINNDTLRYVFPKDVTEGNIIINLQEEDLFSFHFNYSVPSEDYSYVSVGNALVYLPNTRIEWELFDQAGNTIANVFALANFHYSYQNHCFDCPKAVVLQTENVTQNSADIQWINYDENITWQYAYNTGTIADTLNPQSVVNYPLALSGLTSNTNYQIWIRSVCGENSYGKWTNASFRTLQVPDTSTYFCDFENVNERNQWTFINTVTATPTTSAFWCAGTFVKKDGNYGLYVSTVAEGTNNNYNNSSEIIWAYRDIYFTPAQQYTISFDWKCNGNSNDYAAAYIGDPTDVSLMPWNNDNTDYSSMTLLKNDLKAYTSWQNFSTTLDDSFGGKVQRIYFKWVVNGNTINSPAIALDNIMVLSDDPLAGHYTINNSLPTVDRNFNSFEEALTILNTRGISDSVFFDIPSNQEFNISLTNYEGLKISSSGTIDKPIYFQKQGEGANPKLKVAGTSASNDAVFTLSAVQYITIDGIDIENAGTSATNYVEQGFCLNANCSYNTIKNCNIRLRAASSNYGVNLNKSVGTFNGNLFENINIKQAYYGYYSNPYYVGENNKIRGGIIDSVSYAGIYVSYENNMTIENVKMFAQSNAVYGICLGNNSTINIINNLIVNFTYGIYCNTNTNSFIAHNTIYSNKNSSYCLYLLGSINSKVRLNNNIFHNAATSYAFCISNTSGSDNSTILPGSDHNIYYSATNQYYVFLLNNYSTTLSQVNMLKAQLADGRESHSEQWQTLFESVTIPYNFNVLTNIATKTESGGMYLDTLAITTDIDGYPRSTTTPDCGAYEFDGIRDTSDLSALAGIYTIDNTLPTLGRNFNTVKQAITALTARGTSDSVYFHLIAGQVHNISATADSNKLTFNYIGTAQKPVIFRKFGEGNKPIFNFTGTTSTADYGFNINGAQHLTFEELDIRNAGTSSSNYLEQAFYLYNASNITIKDCDIRLNNTTSFNYFAINSNNSCSYNTFENNNITKTYYGITAYTGTGESNKIIGNSMDSVGYGIHIQNRQNNLIIKGSKINANSTSSGYGIVVYAGSNVKIYNNVITNFIYGIYLSNAILTDTLTIANNTILSATIGAQYCIYKYGVAPIKLYNNIITNISSNASAYCFNNDANDNIILPESNNNIYYCNAGKLYRSSSATAGVSTLEEYKTVLGDGRENQSHFELPPFISTTYPYNLNIQTDVLTCAESGGKQSSWIEDDIDGNPRCGSSYYDGGGISPDVGAYEFEGQSYFVQTICSGATTTPMELGSGQTFYFSLISVPQYITGYVSSGTNVLPAMTLFNSSTENTDTLRYQITSEDLNINYIYTISVRRTMPLSFDNLYPENGGIFTITYPITVSWNAIEQATSYDLYFWNAAQNMPTVPTKSNFTTNSYTHPYSLVYGNSYKWLLIAKNACNQIVSDTMMFEVRSLPNLHVSSLSTTPVDSSRRFTISWTVKNDGNGATIEPQWTDKIWLMNSITDPNGTYYTSNATLLHQTTNLQSLNAGESYSNSIEITLPGRWHGNYYLMVATDMNNVYSINWTPAGGTPPAVYQPNINGSPYPYLVAFTNGTKVVYEEGGSTSSGDNFFYSSFIVPRPPLQPIINPSTDSIQFVNRVIMMRDSLLIQVTTQDLLAPVTLSFSGGYDDNFSASFAPNWSDSLGGNIIVKFHPEETGNLFSYLTISAANKQAVIYVTGKSVLPTMYNIELATNTDVYSDADTVHIAGSATFINGWTAANVLVNISIEVLGYKRQYQVVTDQNGNFVYNFIPQHGESGHYKIYAFKPGYQTSEMKDEFDIPGMKLYSSAYIRWDTELEIPLQGNIAVQNRSNVPLTNVSIELVQGLPNANVVFGNIPTLAGSGVANVSYTVTGTALTTSGNWEEMQFKLTCDEGITVLFSTWFHCKPTHGIIEVSPSYINTLMTKGHVKLVELLVVNNGNGPTGKVAVSIPNVDWMTLISPDTMTSIAAHDSAKITLWLSPTQNTPLHVPFNGNIAINCANGSGKSVPYTIQAVSDSTGNLVVDVVDEYYYNTVESPHLAGAHVRVTHPYSFVTIAEGYTDANGLFTVNNIPEGYYKLFVEAANHSNYSNNILVQAGETLNKQVFLSFQAITYTWEVVPTTIEDHYEITLVTQYQTNVPTPVVVVQMPVEMPYLIGEETYSFNAIMTNVGLITAENVTLNFPDDPEYTFDYLMSGFDLPAQQTMIVPVVMRRINPFGVGGGTNPAPMMAPQYEGASGPCSGLANTHYEYWCGEKKNKTTSNQIKHAGRICTGTQVINGGSGDGHWGGGGYGGGGWGGYGTNNNSNIPIVWKDPGCCKQEDVYFCAASYAFTAIGCLPGAGGIIGAIGGYLTDLAGGGDPTSAAITSGVGLIPGFGCIWSFYWNFVGSTCVNAVRCIMGLGPVGGSGGSGGSSGGGGGPHPAPAVPIDEPVVPPTPMSVIPQPVSPNNWTFDYDAVEEKLQKLTMIDIYKNQLLSEIYGDTNILNHENYIDFANAIQTFSTPELSQIPFDDYNILHSGMPDSLYFPFINRWNSTIEANVMGVYSPNTQYPNIMDNERFIQIGDSIEALVNWALAHGYSSLEDMYEDVIQDLEWHSEDLNSYTQRGTCATVTMQLTQTMTMTREAFRGTLTIHNGNEETAMTNIHLELEIRDENGVISNDLFQIETETLTVMTEIDGTGSLSAASDGSATVLFIPEVGAAPTTPKIYSFGGTLSYTDPFSGETVTAPLFPVALEVNPSPYLDLYYFWQRDVFGDDPFTEQIEPRVPAEIGVMIHNKGYGTAQNVMIESAQPQIIENDKGLLIDFQIIGSSLGAQERQLGVMDVNFGNIAPQTAKVGHWWLTASLLGHFVSYSANIIHLDSYGNPELSLVDTVQIHELIRSINAYGNLEDSIPDFLVNDINDSKHYPDYIYFSNATKTRVWLADTAYCDGNVTPQNLQVNLAVVPDRVGWNYAQIDDPANGRYTLMSILREDGQEIPLSNVWQTKITMPDHYDPIYENKLHFVDTFSTTGLMNYTLIFYPKTDNPLRIDSIIAVTPPLTSEVIPVINEPLTELMVYFNKPVYQPTFSWKDLELHCQGGENLIDTSIVPTIVNDSTYLINLLEKTSISGYYNFIVQAAEIFDMNQFSGEVGTAIQWIQNLTNIDTILYVSICEGESYLFNNVMLTSSGIYIDTLQKVNLADSIIQLILTVNPTYIVQITDTITIAEGSSDSYHFFDQNLNENGIFYHILQTVNGCDSTIVLDLTVYITSEYALSICDGDSIAMNHQLSQYYYQSGTYIDTFPPTGVNQNYYQIITLHLTVNPIYTHTDNLIICDNELPITYGDSTFAIGTVSGNYPVIFNTIAGCDSLITLTLIVNPTYNTPISATICDNETYNFFGETLTTAGTYTHLLQTVNSCDSLITLTLIVNPTYNTPISATICDNETYSFFGENLTTAGTYTHLLQTVNNCDSLITLTLIVNPTYNTPISATICDNETYNFFGENLTTAGTYTHLLQTVNSCDSLITLTLIVNPTYNTPIFATICDNETYNFFGETLTTAGTYTHLLQTVNSCDSLITLTLIVNPTYNTPISATICDNETYNFFGETLTTAGIYTHLLQTVNSCDSLITLTLIVNPSYNTPISATICDNETYNFFGQDLNITGIYTHLLQTVNNCDSLITLTLIVNPTYNTPISATICDNETYNFFGETLTTAGTYTHLLQTVNSCDSLITLTLIVNPSYNTPISATICDNETYNFFGQDLNITGIYTHLLQTESGCDSIIVLTLTVNPLPETPSAIFGETVITNSGIYNYSVETVNNAIYYIWTCSNPNWELTTNMDINAQLNIQNGGIGILSVATINDCDTSEWNSITIQSTVGISTFNRSDITVYPNPTSDKLTIDVGTKSQEIRIEILNMEGQLLSSSILQSKTISLSRYSAGIYFIKIYGRENELLGIKKVSKQ